MRGGMRGALTWQRRLALPATPLILAFQIAAHCSEIKKKMQEVKGNSSARTRADVSGNRSWARRRAGGPHFNIHCPLPCRASPMHRILRSACGGRRPRHLSMVREEGASGRFARPLSAPSLRRNVFSCSQIHSCGQTIKRRGYAGSTSRQRRAFGPR